LRHKCLRVQLLIFQLQIKIKLLILIMIIIIIINKFQVLIMLSDLKSRYENYIQSQHLKTSKRRDIIFNYISTTRGHFTADNIYQNIMKVDAGIGIATVYRTIRLLVDCDVLIEHTFGEKKGYFEVNDINSRHHDHLICTSCGNIIEFQCDLIEDDKQRIAKQYKFEINSHKLEIFGLCSKCQQKK